VEKYEHVDVKQRSALGKLLSQFNDRIIKVDGEPYRFSIEGKGHSRRFRVEKIGDTCTVSKVSTVFPRERGLDRSSPTPEYRADHADRATVTVDPAKNHVSSDQPIGICPSTAPDQSPLSQS
jgi:hypothetical protein